MTWVRQIAKYAVFISGVVDADGNLFKEVSLSAGASSSCILEVSNVLSLCIRCALVMTFLVLLTFVSSFHS